MAQDEAVMEEDRRGPGKGFYLAAAYIVAMYIAYYYFWGKQFVDYVKTVLGSH